MNHDAEAIIRKELDAGERLLWSGIPKQGVTFKSADVFMIPFSLLWGGFALFWEYSVLTIVPHGQHAPAGADWVFPLFGIPFVVAGLYMIFGRFIYDAKKREKTFYGLTEQRAIIVSGLFGRRITSLNIRTMTDVALVEKSGGRGSILFGREDQMASSFMRRGFPGMGSTTPQFELIEDAKQVFRKLTEQQKRAD